MGLSDYEQNQLQQIEEWMNTLKREQELANDFLQIYDNWLDDMVSLLPEEIFEKVFSSMDQFLLYIQAAIQETERLNQKNEKIMQQARIWNPDIRDISELKNLPLEKLQHIADREIKLYHMYALVQGGLTGTGKAFLLTMDFPTLILINLRAIQSLALCYGFPAQHPKEALIVLKTFHSATLPNRFQHAGWSELVNLLKNQEPNFYEEHERISDVRWVNTLLFQIMKAVIILLFRKHKGESPSLLGMTIGASSNYLLTKQVTEWANRFFQYRYLLEKKEAIK